jgi:CO/xanthine dehydrogenase Mo-binding subunit
MATEAGFRVVGQPLPRVDAAGKVTGEAGYVGDLRLPGMQHAVLVRSEMPHARVTRIDVADAREVPGVSAVLTATELAGIVTRNRFGPVVRDAPLLAEDVVRYEGEPIVMVVARSPDAAARAAALVEVDYDELPVVGDVEAALDPASPRLHGAAEQGEFGGRWGEGFDPGRNIVGAYHDLRGDPEAAFRTAAHVFEGTYRLPAVYHYTLENQVALADADRDGITLYASNQYPFLMVRLLADLFRLPESAIRVVVPFVGGAFGSKEYVNIVPLAVAASRAVGAPVRLGCSLEESFRTASRHGATMTFRTGLDGDARIVARDVRLLFDSGAYADQGPRVIRQAGYRSPGPYRIPNLAVEALAIYTNKVPAGAYRGFGASQPIFACERHTDEIAAALGIDPVELRLRNLLGLGDDFAAGDLPLDCDLPAALRLAAEALREGRGRRESGAGGGSSESGRASGESARRRGVGFAVGVKNTASGRLTSSAIVRLHADGSATVLASGVEFGQGTLTMLATVAAETLGLPLERVRATTPDTAVTPFEQRTSSSRSTVHLGVAVQRAAEDARRQALELAASVTGCRIDELDLRDGGVVGAGEAPIAMGRLFNDPGSRFGGEIIGVGHFVPENPEAPTAFGMRATYWEGSVGAAEVAVDPETGEVEITRFVTVGDAGTVLNPLAAHGQEEGGAAMAMGHALFEACLYEDGRFVNPSLVDYRVPTTLDVPLDLESHLLERGDGPGPFGSKGLGESAIITSAPAIANAVAAATGIQPRELPLTPDRVLAALDALGED